MLWYEKIIVAFLAVVAACLAVVPFLILGLLYYWFMWKNPDVNPQARGAEVVAQCRDGSCPPARAVPGPASPRTSDGYRWVELPDDDDQVALYDGDRYVGNWSHRWGYFRPVIGNGWGDACRPPIKPPVPSTAPVPVPSSLAPSRDAKADPVEETLRASPLLVVAQVADELPTGVDLDKIGRGPEYAICDERSCRPISREKAIEAIERGVPDDSAKLRLTLIGTTEDRKRVEADLAAAENADLRERLNLWSVEPSHWSVADVGFKTDGKPTIYLQAPSGKVIGREDAYEGPATIAAIRKKADGYDAKKDLTIKVQPVVNLNVPWPQVLTGAGLVGLAGLLILGKGKS